MFLVGKKYHCITKKFNLYDAHPQISQLNNLKASVKKYLKNIILNLLMEMITFCLLIIPYQFFIMSLILILIKKVMNCYQTLC